MTEQEFRDRYYDKAGNQTLETLPHFIEQMFGESLGYGSVCCAVAASALAAAWAANKQDRGGITGFQAGAVMWEFVRQWNYKSNNVGLRIIDYDNMLYSQYEDDFQKTICKDTFEALQKEAQNRLNEDKAKKSQYIVDMECYNTVLAAFVKKFPDYHTRRKHYDHLGAGTGDEHAAYDEKKKEGFEFTPREPFYHAGQLEHWQSIVDGVVPFGYQIKE